MPTWTNEQRQAIDIDNSNIVVSAGAGSGKTAVLTERVIRKIKNGININQLLILTFTNKAAMEMKERIRKAIKKDKALIKQLDYIDESYITTFDSYSLSVVKKYHYLLNISSNVKITASSIIALEKSKIITQIFDDLYQAKDKRFFNLIDNFTMKDDKEIMDAIITINNKLDLKSDKRIYLTNYIENNFNDEFIKEIIRKWLNLILDKIKIISITLTELSNYVDLDYFDNIKEILEPLLNAKTYDEIIGAVNVSLPNIKKGSDEESKKYKALITDTIKDIKDLARFNSEQEIKDIFILTKDYVEIIIEIICLLDSKIEAFKHDNEMFEFNDISKMAIRVVKDNGIVRDELKNSFNEIMIDEYQDTSDLQEEFINLIASNNVYMVGDIKQSIYRFRNANPYLFKAKYDSYSSNNGGIKIDLTKNFRSRDEVLNNINEIFSLIMTDELGGASYITSHKMIFGNNSYIEEGKTNQNNNLEIYNYNYDRQLGFSKEEIELFIMAKDIKSKMENAYQIFDKDEKKLRNINYSDFAILIDRSTNFDLIKKIFEFFSIPVTKLTTNNIVIEDETFLIKNIIGLLIKAFKCEYDTDFNYYFTSIARSYLFNINDQIIFDYLNSGNFNDSDIMQIIKEIIPNYEIETPYEILKTIINKFGFYYKQIRVGDVKKRGLIIDSILETVKSLSDLSYSLEDIFVYLDYMIKEQNKIEIKVNDEFNDSVKVMTIHTSKGLEYHICYFPLLYSKFNISELNDKFMYDEKYGIVTPYFKEGIGKTILKDLVKDNYLKEEISEKLRLFYVALTRCKEKMIMVANLTEDTSCINNIISVNERLKYRSFLDILNSIKEILVPYIKEININSLNITRDYNLIKDYNYEKSINKVEEKIENREIRIENDIVKDKKFSKVNSNLIDKKTREKMLLGTNIHNILEYLDFNNPNFEDLNIDDYMLDKIRKFLNTFDFINADIYKEYQFMYEKNNELFHGVIDLLLVYDNKVVIVDYKLKDIVDDNYKKQLLGYKKYIESKTNKVVEICLYSIIDEILDNIII